MVATQLAHQDLQAIKGTEEGQAHQVCAGHCLCVSVCASERTHVMMTKGISFIVFSMCPLNEMASVVVKSHKNRLMKCRITGLGCV